MYPRSDENLYHLNFPVGMVAFLVSAFLSHIIIYNNQIFLIFPAVFQAPFVKCDNDILCSW
jgi:hypothetical protein